VTAKTKELFVVNKPKLILNMHKKVLMAQLIDKEQKLLSQLCFHGFNAEQLENNIM
jgi:hypothetical protein